MRLSFRQLSWSMFIAVPRSGDHSMRFRAGRAAEIARPQPVRIAVARFEISSLC
jgi:hypothetical protein